MPSESATQVWANPADTAVAFVIPLTGTGVLTPPLVVPLPS